MLQPGLPDPDRFQQADHYSALAQQCFINEYVFASGDDEIRQAIGLREYLSDQLANAALSKIELGRDGYSVLCTCPLMTQSRHRAVFWCAKSSVRTLR